ncbi:MAG: sugar transporter permease [Paenibacillus sp.]|jgi:putative aldouronate transport system permease protein|nr:sugar transporter permease [Paenibacillus sp.]
MTRQTLVHRIASNAKWSVFVIALPGILHFLVFKYYPLFGNVIAFQDYNLFLGIWNSPWVGFEHFIQMFSYGEFFKILRNTLILSLYQLLFGFPAPLVLALLLNEIRLMWFKRINQSLLYLPHFLSWIVVGGMFIKLLAPEGIVSSILETLFGLKGSNIMTEPGYFRTILVSVGIWKGVGWGTIIYLAALAGINPDLYEAAAVDGASRWKQMRYITLPSLMPAIVMLFLLNISNFLDQNVEQVLVFLNPLVRDVGEVIDTYVYRVGLEGARFSYTTAIDIFKSVVGLVLVVSLNQLSKRTTGESIY